MNCDVERTYSSFNYLAAKRTGTLVQLFIPLFSARFILERERKSLYSRRRISAKFLQRLVDAALQNPIHIREFALAILLRELARHVTQPSGCRSSARSCSGSCRILQSRPDLLQSNCASRMILVRPRVADWSSKTFLAQLARLSRIHPLKSRGLATIATMPFRTAAEGR